MQKRIPTTAVVLLFIAGASWAASAKYGDAAFYIDGENNDIHDAGLYHLKLNDRLWVGNGGLGSGNYPGKSGVATLYAGRFWVGTNAWGKPRVSGDFAPYRAEWHKMLGLLWSDGSSWNQRPTYVTKRGALDSYLKADDRDAKEEGPIGLVVEQHGMQWSDTTNDDYIIFQTYVLNKSGRTLTDEFICLYYDFDIGGSTSYDDDYVRIDYGRKMPYMHDDEPKHPYVGLRILEGKPHTLGVPNIMEDPDTDAKKWALMTSGKWIEQKEPYDWRVCLSSGPHVCANNEKLRFAFAVVAGANLSELQANADAAYNKYWEIYTGVETFWARALPGAVELSWEPNINYAGFNLYRAEATGPTTEVKVNNRLITGRKPFRYVDSTVAADTTYDYTLEAVTLNGGKERYGPVRVKAEGKTKPLSFRLAQNFPNPARTTTTIAFTLAEAGDVTLEVFDLSGRKVATVAEGHRPAGENEAVLDTGNLAAGVYVYRLRAADAVATKRLAVVK
ncbi:MAG TPA: T9SS type A sorting domain-containing protein [bacterium]|nr:T9SS type A sorting domain-containing protein [bacterium]